MELNFTQIQEILPHRYPFLMLDKVTECEPGVSCSAVKLVSGNEQFFQGHFPGQPIMPGVLILEALAQTGAVSILCKEENKGKIVLFGGVKNARFKRQVVPGDILELHCEIIKMYGPMGVGSAVATVNGEIAVKAEITFAIA